MTERGERLAREILGRLEDLEATLAPLSDEDWRRACAAEGWPVGFVAYHIGLGLARQTGWIDTRLAGGPAHAFSWDETHALNAMYRSRHPSPARDDTLRFVRERGERLATLARDLTDEQLDEVAFSYEGRERFVEWIIRAVALRHIDGHHRSVKETLAPTPSPGSASASPTRRDPPGS